MLYRGSYLGTWQLHDMYVALTECLWDRPVSTTSRPQPYTVKKKVLK